jgi:hypothetical protein
LGLNLLGPRLGLGQDFVQALFLLFGQLRHAVDGPDFF